MNGTLITLDGNNYSGDAEFGETGVIFCGVPVPLRVEVIGLEPRTFFVPYAQIRRVVFDEVQSPEIDKLFGGSE